jgi:transposase InsO family protein
VEKVATALDKVVALRKAPESITVDNGTEFASKATDIWAYKYRVHLDFIRPGKPLENGYIESFNGKLRGEWLCIGCDCTCSSGNRTKQVLVSATEEAEFCWRKWEQPRRRSGAILPEDLAYWEARIRIDRELNARDYRTHEFGDSAFLERADNQALRRPSVCGRMTVCVS